MLAQMDVAQLVIIPVTAPMHMVQEWKTLQKNPFTGAVVGSPTSRLDIALYIGENSTR